MHSQTPTSWSPSGPGGGAGRLHRGRRWPRPADPSPRVRRAARRRTGRGQRGGVGHGVARSSQCPAGPVASGHPVFRGWAFRLIAGTAARWGRWGPCCDPGHRSGPGPGRCSVHHRGEAGQGQVGRGPGHAGAPHHASPARRGHGHPGQRAVRAERGTDDRQVIRGVVDGGRPQPAQPEPGGHRDQPLQPGAHQGQVGLVHLGGPAGRLLRIAHPEQQAAFFRPPVQAGRPGRRPWAPGTGPGPGVAG